MQQFYVYLNDQQEGPYTIQELKNIKIQHQTKVWCEGLTEWKAAQEIDDLKPLLATIPPPLVPPIQQQINTFVSSKNKDAVELNKPVFYTITGVVGLVLIVMYFYTSHLGDKYERQLLNHQTQNYNNQIEEQEQELIKKQILIEDQNKKIAEQKLIEEQRIQREKQLEYERKKNDLNQALSQANQNLLDANRKLVKAGEFQLFRTSSERAQQIGAAQQDVFYYNQQVKDIEAELNQLSMK